MLYGFVWLQFMSQFGQRLHGRARTVSVARGQAGKLVEYILIIVIRPGHL